MINVLILGKRNPVAKLVTRELNSRPDVHVTVFSANPQRTRDYVPELAGQNVIASFLGPMNVDLDFEALFDAIDQVRPPLKRFLMLSHAGVDHEVHGPLEYPGVSNLKEYFNEQRYAAKVVDESELPYTILRPVTLVKQPARRAPQLIEEGRPVPSGHVSVQSVARVALAVILKRQYLNQSIAIIDK